MKLTAKISVVFDCHNCGERCENESDFIWIDEGRIFRCDFCGATAKIQFVRLRKRRKAMIEKHFVQQITIDEQINEVKREIAMRNKVYPKWIEAGSLKKSKADFQILAMEAVLISLQDLAKKTAPQGGLF